MKNLFAIHRSFIFGSIRVGFLIFYLLVPKLQGFGQTLKAGKPLVIKVAFTEKTKVLWYYYYDAYSNFQDSLKVEKLASNGKREIQSFELPLLHPISLHFIANDSESMLYVKPGDTLSVGAKDDALPVLQLNGIYNKEQDFIETLRQRGLSLQDDDLSWMELNNKVNTNALSEELESKYHHRRTLLAQYSDSLGYSQEYQRLILSEFKLLLLTSSLRLHFYLHQENKPSPEMYAKIDRLGHWLLSDTNNIACRRYLFAIYDWYHYVSRDEPRAPGRWDANLYQNTSKYLPTKQSELVRNYMLRSDCNCFGEPLKEKLITDFIQTCSQKDLVENFQKFFNQ